MANKLVKGKKKEERISIVSWAVSGYLMMLFVIYPLYAGGGYTVIDDTKYMTYKVITIFGFIVMIPVIIWGIIKKKIDDEWKSEMTTTDICVATYAMLVLLSSVLSYYKDAAFGGQAGWYLGCILIESCCLIYFIVSRFYTDNAWVTRCALWGSGTVFMLGALNRFGCWPIDLEIPYQYDFISTIGNIGWYCGFLAVVAPLGIGLYIIKKDLSLTDRILLGIYVFIVFFTGSSQGGDTIYVFYAVLFVGMMCLCGYAKCGLDRLLEVVMMWASSILLIAFIRNVKPDCYHFETENLCGKINGGLTGLWVLIPIALIYLWVILKKPDINYLIIKHAGITMFFIGLVLVIAGLAMVIVSDLYYFHNLAIEDETVLSKMIIDYEWGNDRGATMIIGLESFVRQNFVHKLFGAGPDCMASFTYYENELSILANEFFGEALLANAHNEVITSLVHIGIAGTVAFYGMMSSFIISCLKCDDEKALVYALCIICVAGYGLFNYAHILSFPFIFIMIAIGNGLIKKSTKTN